MAEEPPKQPTWGGRFETKPDALMTRINASIGFDKRLWRQDIAGSKAHAAMLREQGIIGDADAAAILEGLDRIAAEYERDGVPERAELEDIHMTVEHRLGELIGEAAGRFTRRARATTRSRPTFGCGCATRATRRSIRCAVSSGCWSSARRNMPKR